MCVCVVYMSILACYFHHFHQGLSFFQCLLSQYFNKMGSHKKHKAEMKIKESIMLKEREMEGSKVVGGKM